MINQHENNSASLTKTILRETDQSFFNLLYLPIGKEFVLTNMSIYSNSRKPMIVIVRKIQNTNNKIFGKIAFIVLFFDISPTP